MPVFNDEVYLEESINTVVNQTLKDIELICINDGSTDNSLNILNNLKQKYGFIKIFNQYNQGSGKARNNGIQKAKGEYIAFLDSDDRFVDSDALERMYNAAIKNNANMVSANLKGITVKNELVNNDDGVERFTEENIIKGSQYGIPYAFYKNIFKRSFLNKHNFRFPDLKRGQDPVFLSEIITKVDRIPVLPLDLYGFRYAPTGGLSKINTFEKKWDYIKHFRDVFYILKQAEFIDIFEDYKEKLFLYINHAQNSSDEVIYTIVHEIFKDDYDILKECEKYFNIDVNNNDLVKNNIHRGLLPTDEIYDLKIKINYLKTINQNLSNENNLLITKNNLLSNDRSLDNKFKYNNIKLLDENKYLLKKNYLLRMKINQLYDYNKNCLSTNNVSKSFLELTRDQFDYYNQEYNDLIKKQYEYDLLVHNVFSDSLTEISLRQNIYYNNLAKVNDQIEDINMRSLKALLSDKNIAYVLYGFPTLSETFIINELRWLRENNINVKVFSYMDPKKQVDLDFDIETYRFDNGGDLSENLEKLLIEHEIDFMHTHFVYPTGTKFTFPISNKLKIPFTIFAHAFDIFIKENDLIINIYEITNSYYCKGVFTLSNYHKNYLLKRGVPNEKIILTRQATKYEINSLMKKDKPIKNVVSISRFVEKKGLDVLIKVASLLKDEDLEFSIYGFGDLEDSLKNQINDLGLDNISVKGSLDNFEEVKKVFRNADLLVSPCRVAKNGDRDGIPTVLFESMGYGVPVLTTSVSAIPEVITDYENGFMVNPDNPEELSAKIKEIMSLSPEQLFEIRNKAQVCVQEISSIEKTMMNVLDVWSKI